MEAYWAEKEGKLETVPLSLTSSVEAGWMLPAPSVTMKPPTATGSADKRPTMVKARAPVGTVVLV